MKQDKLIKSVIKGRETTYYLTTGEDLNEIKTKHILGDIFVILFSISVGGIISVVLTKSVGNLSYDIVRVLDVLMNVFIVSTVVTAIFAGYFYVASFGLIRKIKTSGEIVSLTSTDDDEISGLQIVSAVYWTNFHSRDVTEILPSKIVDDKLSTIANNELSKEPDFDPHPGVGKKLTITYKHNGKQFQRVYNEHDKVELP